MKGSFLLLFSAEKMALCSLSGSSSFAVGLQFLRRAEQMKESLKALLCTLRESGSSQGAAEHGDAESRDAWRRSRLSSLFLFP